MRPSAPPWNDATQWPPDGNAAIETARALTTVRAAMIHDRARVMGKRMMLGMRLRTRTAAHTASSRATSTTAESTKCGGPSRARASVKGPGLPFEPPPQRRRETWGTTLRTASAHAASTCAAMVLA